MNEAASQMFLNIINLAVRMLPVFVCLEPKRSSRENIAAVSAYLWVIMVSLQSLLQISDQVFYLFQAVFSCLFFLVLLIFFQGSVVEKVFLYLSAWLFAVLSVSLNEFVSWMLESRVNLSHSQICVMVSIFSACGFYVFVRFWLQDAADQLFTQLSRWSCTLLLAYPAIALVIIMFGNSTIFSRDALTAGGFESVVFFLALSVMILVLYVMILNSILEIVSRRQTEEELQFARQMIGAQREHYDQMLHHIEEVRIIKHDFRHHIHALLQMERDERTRYLQNLQNEFESSAEAQLCENQAVNGILQEYAVTCQTHRIEFQTRLDLSAHIPIDDLTLCIVIGNLLENGVEACRKLSGHRFIHMQARWMEDRLMMIVENSYNGQIHQRGNSLMSSKKDGGLGMVSIRRILNHPGDEFEVDYDDSKFTAMVSIGDRGMR